MSVRRADRGFTLVELIVVLVVLGLLAALGTATFRQAVVRSHDASARQTLAALGREAVALAATRADGTVLAADVVAAADDLPAAAGAGPQAAAPGWAVSVFDKTVPGSGVAARASGTVTIGVAEADGEVSEDPPRSAVGLAIVSASGNCQLAKVSAGGVLTWGRGALGASCSGVTALAGPAGSPTTTGPTTTGPTTTGPTTTVAPPTLPAPTGLVAVAGETHVALSWNPVPGAASYRVYRNSLLVAQPAGASHTDTGLTPSTTYTYQVSAVDGAGQESAPSTPVNATTGIAFSVTDTFNRANTTTGLGVTSDGTQAWQQIAGNTIVSSNQARGSSLPALSVLDVGSPNMTAQVLLSGVGEAEVRLVFRVVDADNYLYVRKTNSTTLVVGRVEAGVDTVLASGSGTLNSWLRVSVSGSTITATSGTVSVTATSSSFAGATRAGIRFSGSAYADDFSAAAESLAAPPAPAGLRAETVPAPLTLSWSPPPTADPAVAYRVYRNGVLVGQTAATSFTDLSAPAGVLSYQVAAVDGFGNEGAPSAPLPATRAPAGSVSVSDTFGRANTTDGLGVTSDGTQAWQQITGNTTVSANQAQGTSLPALSVLDVGSPNMTAQVLLSGANATAVRLVFRVVGADNYLYVRKTNSTTLVVGRVEAGVDTVLASGSGTLNSWLRVSVSGSTITATSGTVSVTATSSSFAGATRAGIRFSSVTYADDFSAAGS